jgi:KRAB domain-containing zinc finger protein
MEYTCNYCEEDFSSNSALKTHIVRKHTFEKNFKCDDCGDEFYTKADLNIHVLKNHGNEQDAIKCHVSSCDYICYNKSHLVRHFEKHEKKNEIQYICDICQEIFDKYKNYKSHKSAHKLPKEYRCTYENCDKVYSRSNGLAEHVQNYHINPIFNCAYENCDRKFKTEKELTDHIDYKHLKTKKFTCSYENCTAAFPLNKTLLRHVKLVHQNVKNFTCNICNKKFQTLSHLQRHVNTHNDEYNFPCNTCDGKFKTNYELIAHVNRIHKCFICETFLETKNDLLIHLNEIHKQDCLKIQKKKEHEISKLLDKHGISYKREHQIDFKCIQSSDTYCRIDFVIIKDGIVIFLEVDEEQHLWYSQACETRRMAQVFQSLMMNDNTLPVVFLRYNPDKFYIDEEEQKLTKTKRHEILIDEINKCDTITTNTIKYLFYNTLDDVPEVLNDVEYLSEIKSLVNYIKMNC